MRTNAVAPSSTKAARNSSGSIHFGGLFVPLSIKKTLPHKADLLKQQTQYMPTALHKKSNRQQAEIKATL
jgi:hypothetical protein